MLPVSVVLANDDVMLCLKPGQHGRCAEYLFLVPDRATLLSMLNCGRQKDARDKPERL